MAGKFDKFIRPKKKKIITPDREAPRAKEDINKDYQATCGVAGEIQYKIETLKQSLAQANNRISQLHQEANEREAMDKLAPKDTPDAAAAPTKAELTPINPTQQLDA